jgi:UDP-N-acetylmuramate--alanine ligase
MVWVCDVYAAGETPLDGISSDRFTQDLSIRHPNVLYVPDFEAFPDIIRNQVLPNDTIVCLGAGSISTQSVALIQKLKGKHLC